MIFDKKVLYIIIAIMVISGLSSYLTNTSSLIGLLLTIPGVLIAITFHEFAHALAADKLGDDTPRRQGRLSLNPIDHLDPVGSIMLLFAGFGWGKPVEVDSRNFNRDISTDKANAIVSIAGPLMNFALAIVFTIVYGILGKFLNTQIASSQVLQLIMMMIGFTISINVGLGVFNLIPLPPLDGSKVIKPFLPYNAKVWFENNEEVFYIIFVILWITGIAGNIISPVISFIYQLIMQIANIFWLIIKIDILLQEKQ